jgi:glycosyltransferase involved in cell wall biosynthesis
MRAIHVVPHIAHEASGPSITVPKLCDALGGRGIDVALHVLHGEGSHRPSGRFRVVEHAAWGPFKRRLGASPAMLRALREEVKTAEIIHNHSFWMMPNVYPGWAVAGSRCTLVESPRGVLSQWAMRQGRAKKHVLWWLMQKRSANRARLFHATAEAEAHDIRAAGFRQPIAIIPNGIDVPSSIARVRERGARKRLLYLGRLHPVKGVDHLLRAWTEVARDHADWELVLVGPDDDAHAARYRDLAREIDAPRTTFLGPRYGADKWAELARASLFVLPTHSENFGIAVAEALAGGVPVVVTKGAPWGGLVTENCGWWIDIGVEPLVRSLRDSLASTDVELAEMGRRGREWMIRDFSWADVGRKMAKAYEWMLGGGERPDFMWAGA